MIYKSGINRRIGEVAAEEAAADDEGNDDLMSPEG